MKDTITMPPLSVDTLPTDTTATKDGTLALQLVVDAVHGGRFGVLETAETLARAALAVDPHNPEAVEAVIVSLIMQGRVSEALAEATTYVAGPWDALPGLRDQRGYLRLLTGDYATGFANMYDDSLHAQSLHPDAIMPGPPWRGEDLAGKTVVYWSRTQAWGVVGQCLGDTILFARYIPLLAARGAKVIVSCHPALLGLFRLMPGVTAAIEIGDTLPPYDYQVYERTLPHLLGSAVTGIPRQPYIHADTERVAAWRGILPAMGNAKLRVGIVWQGDPVNPNDRRRSMTFEQIEPLLAVPGVQFVSLQFAPGDADLAGHANVVNAGPMLRGFAETAACVAACDLVITIDSSTANLCGALGVPVWVLLALAPDFRWGPAGDVMRSPWFPSARMFRQTEDGDWTTVVADVVTALKTHSQGGQSDAGSVTASTHARNAASSLPFQ